MTVDHAISQQSTDPVFDVFVAIQNHEAHHSRRAALISELTAIMESVNESDVARAAAKQLAESRDDYGYSQNVGWAVIFDLGSRTAGRSASMSLAIEAAFRNYRFTYELLCETFRGSLRHGRPWHNGKPPSEDRYLALSLVWIYDHDILAEAMERIHRFDLGTRGEILLRYAEGASSQDLYTILDRGASHFSDSTLRLVAAKLDECDALALGTDPEKGFILRRAVLATLEVGTLRHLEASVPENVANDIAWVLAQQPI